MATIAEFRLDADAFPLGTVFTHLPDATVVLERVVPTNKYIIPYFWVHHADAGNIETIFKDRLGIDRVELIDSIDDEYLVRIEWSADTEDILSAIAKMDVTLLSGEGNADEWRFELRGADQDAIASFHEYCREHDMLCELSALHSLASMHTGSEYELTETQLEALLFAYNHGYYETPREATLQDLAEELGISRQALASRLRRGTSRLIASTLADPGKNH